MPTNKVQAKLVHKSAVRNFLTIPRSSNDEVFTVNSFTEPGIKYRVSLTDLTCGCPDWENNRQCFDYADARRLCKHLCKIMRQNNRIPAHPWLFACLPMSAFADIVYVLEVAGDTVIVITQSNTEWIDVYAPKRSGGYDRFGYHIASNRWSYGEAPRNPMAIKEFIRAKPANPVVSQMAAPSPSTPLPDVKFSTDFGGRRQRGRIVAVVIVMGALIASCWFGYQQRNLIWRNFTGTKPTPQPSAPTDPPRTNATPRQSPTVEASPEPTPI